MTLFNFLITAGSIVVCIGLALVGFQFLCVAVSFAAIAIWGVIQKIIDFLLTKH